VPAAWPGRAGRYRADLTGRNEISVPRPMGREKERGLLAARLRTSKRLRSKPDSKRLNSGPICRSRRTSMGGLPGGGQKTRRACVMRLRELDCYYRQLCHSIGNFVIPTRKTPKKNVESSATTPAVRAVLVRSRTKFGMPPGIPTEHTMISPDLVQQLKDCGFPIKTSVHIDQNRRGHAELIPSELIEACPETLPEVGAPEGRFNLVLGSHAGREITSAVSPQLTTNSPELFLPECSSPLLQCYSTEDRP
jgi:hypothetical protein